MSKNCFSCKYFVQKECFCTLMCEVLDRDVLRNVCGTFDNGKEGV